MPRRRTFPELPKFILDVKPDGISNDDCRRLLQMCNFPFRMGENKRELLAKVAECERRRLITKEDRLRLKRTPLRSLYVQYQETGRIGPTSPMHSESGLGSELSDNFTQAQVERPAMYQAKSANVELASQSTGSTEREIVSSTRNHNLFLSAEPPSTGYMNQLPILSASPNPYSHQNRNEPSPLSDVEIIGHRTKWTPRGDGAQVPRRRTHPIFTTRAILGAQFGSQRQYAGSLPLSNNVNRSLSNAVKLGPDNANEENRTHRLVNANYAPGDLIPYTKSETSNEAHGGLRTCSRCKKISVSSTFSLRISHQCNHTESDWCAKCVHDYINLAMKGDTWYALDCPICRVPLRARDLRQLANTESRIIYNARLEASGYRHRL